MLSRSMVTESSKRSPVLDVNSDDRVTQNNNLIANIFKLKGDVNIDWWLKKTDIDLKKLSFIYLFPIYFISSLSISQRSIDGKRHSISVIRRYIKKLSLSLVLFARMSTPVSTFSIIHLANVVLWYTELIILEIYLRQSIVHRTILKRSFNFMPRFFSKKWLPPMK